MANEINLETVDFYPVLRWLRDADSRNVGGIEWARVYIETTGNAIAVYKARGRVAVRAASGAVVAPVIDVVQFYDGVGGSIVARDFFPVDFRNLHARDGVNREAVRARETFNVAAIAVPLTKQRQTSVSTRFKTVWR